MRRIWCTLAVMPFAIPLVAQQWQWPRTAQNLMVLPKTTSAEDLRRTMMGFTDALGVRCAYCHVGEEGKDLKEYDFVSDRKPEKDKARVMLKMVNTINTQFLAELNGDNTSSVQVTCITCHHGNALPILLEDKLKQTFDHHGIDSTISQYRALRDQYYGGFTYNFKEGTLLRLAEQMMEDTTRIQAAIKVLKFNIEMYPAYPFNYTRLARIYEEQGDFRAAKENYEQAVRINPKDRVAKGRLERLQKKE